ncbi:SurA N-terminal domain-containing protein [Alloacidobacterium sp.]|uniref:SurA N-terminal domain-containing protein n=1 Tax=Alloacidobacterium sp. TaxID=2951999 RepID=UPI002D32C11D|nr:SurA N-terminal domain-containing protein [Alloacidobacterium sp.]HYK37362.1 SurA N-terminal domain-containing protein [Alloacidobacterium sp.]
MKRHWHIGLLVAFITAVVCLCPNGGAQENQTTGETPVVLDRVIAIVNGDVLLESDVREEMRVAALQPLSVPPGQNTEVNAAQRLIRRALILQQMKAQQVINYSISDDEVKKSLAELRTQIPVCRQIGCATEEGWKAFLKENGLTEQEMENRWRQRLEIIKFINVRFAAGIRITRQDIQKYYEATVVPTFEKMKEKPPTLQSVSPRIQEILLQQQVNSMLRDWLQSLRDQGTVQILDSRFGENNSSDDEDGGGA